MSQQGTEIVSQWRTFIDGFTYSPQTFYQYLEGVIKSRGLDRVSTSITYFAESSMISGKRAYLKVKRKNLTYYICAAPYGQGFFVSSWLLRRHPFFKWLIMKIPILGPPLAHFFFPVSFYTEDTTSMYLTVIHDAIVRTVNYISGEGGKRSLSEEAAKPIVKDFFSR